MRTNAALARNSTVNRKITHTKAASVRNERQNSKLGHLICLDWVNEWR